MLYKVIFKKSITGLNSDFSLWLGLELVLQFIVSTQLNGFKYSIYCLHAVKWFGTLIGTNTPGQNGPGNNGYESILHILQRFRNEASPSDAVWCQICNTNSMV